MEQLRVVGTEDDNLVLATESGERFTLAVDAVLKAELRRTRRDREDADPPAARMSPREIQAQIRAGLSAAEVSELLAVPVETVARYEGPVLAELEHIVDQALAVPVLAAGDFEQEKSPTFGSAVRRKLTEADATGERWTSWKEPSGWVVKLEFVAGEAQRDARWAFDPRRSSLAPLNADAVQLSRQGSLPEGLIPRLRALDTPAKDDARFEGGTFGPRRGSPGSSSTVAAVLPAAPPASGNDAEQDAGAAESAAIKRAPEQSQTSAETADLLEALRRRRGQRAPLPTDESVSDSGATAPPGSAPMALFDALEPGYEDTAPVPPDEADDDIEEPARVSAVGDGRRKGRPSMPSWDEIVFGARSDDA